MSRNRYYATSCNARHARTRGRNKNGGALFFETPPNRTFSGARFPHSPKSRNPKMIMVRTTPIRPEMRPNSPIPCTWASDPARKATQRPNGTPESHQTGQNHSYSCQNLSKTDSTLTQTSLIHKGYLTNLYYWHLYLTQRPSPADTDTAPPHRGLQEGAAT